jgi:PAS domain S-box-containing protein
MVAMKRIHIQIETRIALLYAVFGGLWILFSDSLLNILIPDLALYARIQTYKGWFFVAASALLIYSLIKQEIARRNETVTKLRASEQQYRELFEHMTEGYAYCKMLFEDGQAVDWIYLTVNEAFASLTDLQQVTGKRVSEVIPGIRTSAPELFEIYARVALTGQPEKFEIFLEALNMWFSVSVYSPEKEYFVAVFDVITERKRAEEALRRYELLSEHSRDTILFMRREDGRILEANAAATQAYGYSREELLALTIQDLRAPDTRGLTAEQMAQADAGGILFETVHRRKDGSIFPVEVSSQGATIGGLRTLVSIVRDITKRRQVETALRLAVENLDKRTRELNAILSSVQEYVYIFDAQGRFVFANKKLLELWGLTVEAATGKTMRDLHYPEAVESALWEGVQRVFESGETVTNVTRYTSPAGVAGTYENILAPMFGPGNQVDFVAGSSRDITERERIEAEIESLSKFPTENPNPVLRVRIDGWLTYANAASRELLEVWGCEMNSYLPAEMRNLIAAADESGSTNTVDVPCNEKTYSLMLVPVAESGYVNLYGTDITERKQAEEQLRYQAALLSHVKDAIVASDAQFCLTAWNSGAEALYGWKAEEVLGRNGLELIRTEWPGVDADEMRRAIAETGHWLGEATQARKDGSRFPVEVSSLVLYDDQGQVTGYVSVNRDITERKQAEQALRSSEERFSKAFRASPDAMVISHQSDGLILEINGGWSDLFGYEPEEVIGRSSLELELFGNPEDHKQAVSLLQQQGSLRDFELDIRRKSGEVRQASLSAEKIEINGVDCLLTILRDITAWKQTEAALRESEERLNRAQEIAHLGSWELDLVNNKLTWSDEAYRIFGLEPQEFGATYQAFLEAVHPDDRAAVDQAYSGSIREGRDSYEIEHRVVRRASGEIHTVHEKCEHFRDDSGQIIRSVGMVHDITERVQAEQALRESEAFTKTVLDNLPVGIAVNSVDPTVTFTYMNDNFPKFYRTTREKLAGADAFWDAVYENPGFREEMKNRVLDGIASNDLERMVWADVPIARKGEETTFITARNIPLPGKALMISTVWDVTERKRAEEELRQTLAELKRSNAELEQFAYVASHDLQEPLRGIAGLVELLQQRYQGQLDSRADEYITHIVEGTQRMQTLINDLLAYSRIGRRGEAIQPTPAETALQATRQNLSAAIQEYGATITSDDLPVVKADATQLIQLFQNLIGNAIKFRSERPPHIHVAVAEAGDCWQFSVQDNGIGIDPQYFERIFQVFQRLHTRREYKGTGIGLAICKKIIERHGGQIWVASEPGAGSTFYFTLPKGK